MTNQQRAVSRYRAMLLDSRDIKDYLTVRLKRRKELIKAKKAVKKKK